MKIDMVNFENVLTQDQQVENLNFDDIIMKNTSTGLIEGGNSDYSTLPKLNNISRVNR